jgi:RNA polymerase sigma-70 factor (ECF subfamily)
MQDSAPQLVAAPGGLASLIAELRPSLERFMLARGCEPAEIDDLVQDLCFKVEDLRSGPIASPRAYIFRMAANAVLDARRGRLRQQSRDDSWARAHYGLDLEQVLEASPEDVAISRDLLVRVQAAVDALPPRTAEVLRLYRVEDVPQKEIAGQLKISLSAVEKHLQRAYRALAAVRTQLDRDFAGMGENSDG